jgi:hypothetical protein
MKKIIIAFSLILISSSIYTQTKSGTGFYSVGHDSLLFDGENSSFIKTGDICRVKVTQASGIAIGSRCKLNILDICGKKDTGEVCKEGQIFPDDKLKAGDKISTGPNGYLTIMLSDGKTISFGHNTSMVLNSNYCDNNFATQVLLDVITEWGTAVVEGTVYSYSSLKDGAITTDILKVYEGSVKFQRIIQDAGKQKVEDKTGQMKQLTEDFQSGKISIEEYSKKMAELQKEMTETLPESAITVNAGFQSRIVGTENPTEPIPFDTNENRWWENK